MAKKTASKDSLLHDLATRFEQIKLEGIAMLESACRRDPVLDVRRLPSVGNQTIKVQSKCDKKGKHITVLVSFKLSLTHSDEPRAEPPPIMMRTIVILNYKITQAVIDKQSADQFARTMAVMQAWPYWREFVQSTTARMSLPTFTVAPPDIKDLVKSVDAMEQEPVQKKVARRRKT